MGILAVIIKRKDSLRELDARGGVFVEAVVVAGLVRSSPKSATPVTPSPSSAGSDRCDDDGEAEVEAVGAVEEVV